MKTIILTAVAILWTASALAQAGAADANPVAATDSHVLIKVTSGMNTTSSKPGDPFTGEIINPVALRGATLNGRIDRADHSIMHFSILSLTVSGKTFPVQSRLISIVNSKGDEGKDDLDQRIRIEGGGIIAYGTASSLDEGSEINMSLWQK